MKPFLGSLWIQEMDDQILFEELENIYLVSM